MRYIISMFIFFFFQAEDGIRDLTVTGVQTCALPISPSSPKLGDWRVVALGSPPFFECLHSQLAQGRATATPQASANASLLTCLCRLGFVARARFVGFGAFCAAGTACDQELFAAPRLRAARPVDQRGHGAVATRAQLEACFFERRVELGVQAAERFTHLGGPRVEDAELDRLLPTALVRFQAALFDRHDELVDRLL